MFRSSCLRFLKFLDRKDIHSCSAVKPEIIKEFHISDLHSTPEGRNAYSTRIRLFLEYLADLGYVPETLQLALTTECAQKTQIVQILSEEEIESINNYKAAAKNPIELRSTAIVLIGLRMGLRASDVTGIKMTDISWHERTISVQQQKTNRFVKLPMPVEVGNSLYTYINNGRPRATTNYVFIAHRVPYNKMENSCCRRALIKMLAKNICGFHITRKTFASRMLKTRTGIETIADSLRHNGTSTVLKYLATDSDTMRQCSLTMKGIEVKGGLLS
jgi:integrase